MHDPRRPWRKREWIRIVYYYHACLSITQLADALFGPVAKGRTWAHQLRQPWKTQSDGIHASLAVGIGLEAPDRKSVV